jgi:putative intracellular protease/amidase
MKILMVLTSHDRLGDTGHKTGFWPEEFAAPYYVFKDAGAEITLASPKGGQPPLDPKSDAADAQTDATQRFKADPAAQQQLANTRPLAERCGWPTTPACSIPAATARCGIWPRTARRSR